MLPGRSQAWGAARTVAVVGLLWLLRGRASVDSREAPLPAETPGAALEGDEKASEGLLGARSCLWLICGVLGPRPLKERGVLGGMGRN